MIALLLTLGLMAAHVTAWTLPSHHRKLLHPPHSKAITRAKMAKWATSSVDPSSRVFSPLSYGGDPTGLIDSTEAIAKTVTALLASCNSYSQQHLASWVVDCDGATLDLSGGNYLISAPLSIPPGYGNLHVMQGSLVASLTFPSDRYLIEVGNATVGGTGNNIDIYLSSLFLDAYQVAKGCIHTENVQGGVLGPQIYMFNFTAFGAHISRGFEVTLMQAWAGEYFWGTPKKENGTASVAVGVYKDGNDGVVDDLVVFSSKVGLWVGGEANQVNAVHTWNLANANGGIGILSTAPQSRFSNCYLDWNNMVITAPTLVSVTNGFFLCGGRIVVQAPSDGVVQGLYFAGNEFVPCSFSGYSSVEANGTFTSVSDVTITGTMAQNSQLGVKNTVVTRTVAAVDTPVSSFYANFTGALLFDTSHVPIQTVTVSLLLDPPTQQPVAVVARAPQGGVVRIDVGGSVTGSVTVTVDQSKRRE